MAQAEGTSPHPSLDLLRRVFNHAALLSDSAQLAATYRDASRELGVLATAVNDGTVAAHKVSEAWRKAAGAATQLSSFDDAPSKQAFDLWQSVTKISLSFDNDAQSEVTRQASITGGTGLYGFVNLLERQAGEMTGSVGTEVHKSAKRILALIEATAKGNYGFVDGAAATLDAAYKHALSPLDDANMGAAMSDGPNGIHLQAVNKFLKENTAALKLHLQMRCETAQNPLAQGALKPVYSVTTTQPVTAPRTARFSKRAR
ncbi:MAG: hypothetical protein PSY14_12475 [bacterium]|nr:hypothetical protein [bacterium]